MISPERRPSPWFQRAIEANGLCPWRLDLATWRFTLTEEAAALCGLAAEPGSLTLEAFLGVVVEEDQPAVRAAFRTLILPRDQMAVTFRVNRVQAPVWVRARAAVAEIGDDPRASLEAVGLIEDVTREQSQDYQQSILAQVERLRSVGQMATGIAHDLKQSLAMVVGNGDLALYQLEQSRPDLAKVREFVALMIQAAEDGGQTVRLLQSFGRTREEGAIERVAVADVIAEVAALTAPRWRNASQVEGWAIVLRTEAEQGVVVDGRSSALREALTNLIFNAIDALPHGGQIVVRAAAEDGQARIEVQDDGIGMSPEVQSRVFEPFYTTKGAQGTGLGLPQVVGIVEQHGGTISLASIEGQGTTFTLRLPLAGARRRVAVPPAAATAPGTRRRVLVVDDEALIAEMAASMLRRDGHLVLTATSGEEALALLGQSEVDLAVCDVGLGDGMDGWELAQRIRGEHPAIAVILATGWEGAIDKKVARARGILRVLGKPYRMAELREAIQLAIP